MRAGDADLPGVAFDAHLQCAVGTDRRVVLRNLKILRQIGVVVVLPVETGAVGDLRVDRLAQLEGGVDRGFVQHGQCARKAETGRTDVRVRFVGRLGRTPTEDFRTGLQLDVDFEADHGGELPLAPSVPLVLIAVVFGLFDGLGSHYFPSSARSLKRNGTPEPTRSNRVE